MGVDVFDAIAVKELFVKSIYNSGGTTFKTDLYAGTANGAAIMNEAATSTNPTLIPNRAHTNTGIGTAGGDALSLITGGIETIRTEDPADLAATETSMWLYDKDNDTLQQVTVGADDSGGAGFKLLRITN